MPSLFQRAAVLGYFDSWQRSFYLPRAFLAYPRRDGPPGVVVEPFVLKTLIGDAGFSLSAQAFRGQYFRCWLGRLKLPPGARVKLRLDGRPHAPIYVKFVKSPFQTSFHAA